MSQVLSPPPRASAPPAGSPWRRLRGIASALGQLLGVFGALRGAAADKEPSPIERVLEYREQLLGCAIQLLDDEAAAQQVTLEAIQQALRSPMLVPLATRVGASVTPAAPSVPEGPVGGARPDPLQGAALLRWLERLVINLSLQRLKALSTIGRGGSSETWPALAREAQPAPETQSRPEESTQLTRASQVLSQLPAETRVAVMLVVMQGRSIAEVAELLGCSEVTCRFWLSHGRKLLRRALQRDLVEDDLMSRESRVLVSPGALHDLRRNKKATARA